MSKKELRTQTRQHRHLLMSYPWDAPNSCFFDNGLELWFRVFSSWSLEARSEFLLSVPTSSALATMFHHFDRRLKAIEDPATTKLTMERELGLGQSLVRHLIFDRWDLYETDSAYGCAVTWMQRAVTVSILIH